jgi:hypothetical protein
MVGYCIALVHLSPIVYLGQPGLLSHIHMCSDP